MQGLSIVSQDNNYVWQDGGVVIEKDMEENGGILWV